MPALALPDPPLADGLITLRELRGDDRDAVVAALQDPEIPRWTTIPSPYGPGDFDAWFRRQRDLRAAGDGLVLVIEDREGRLVGIVGLHELRSGRPDIGYWIAREHRGRGYAAAAVRLMRAHAVELGFDRVDLLIQPGNEPSKAVARAAGFAEDGLTRCTRDPAGRDHLRFTWPAP